MDIISFSTGFLVGFLVAAAIIVGLSLYLARKTIRKRQAKLKSLKDDVNKILSQTNIQNSVNERLVKVKNLTLEQLDLRSNAEGPQKNSLHGKHKNSIYGKIKEIEEEKNNIFRSILGDGADPQLAIIDENGDAKTMKLSEYMEYMGIDLEAEPEKKEDNFRKFTVHQGGLSDDKK